MRKRRNGGKARNTAGASVPCQAPGFASQLERCLRVGIRAGRGGRGIANLIWRPPSQGPGLRGKNELSEAPLPDHAVRASLCQGAPEAAVCLCQLWGRGQNSRAPCPRVCFAASGYPAGCTRECPCNVKLGRSAQPPSSSPSGSKSKDIFLALIYFLK